MATKDQPTPTPAPVLTLEEYTNILQRLQDDERHFYLDFDGMTLTMIVSGLQLALRHPSVSGVLAARLRVSTERMIEALERFDKRLGAHMRQGFDESFDVPREDEP